MAGLTPELRPPAGRHGSTSTVGDHQPGLGTFLVLRGAIDADRFIVSLKDLIQDAQRKVFLDHDNPAHRANRVREYRRNEKIELFYLPPQPPTPTPMSTGTGI